MTDSLQPHDVEELLQRYDAERQNLEMLPPAAIELPANQALALVTHLQIAAANPAVKYNPLLQSAIAAAKQIQSTFNPDSSIYEVLELGWQEPASNEGTLPQILRSEPRRPKRLQPPPYWPDDHHHF